MKNKKSKTKRDPALEHKEKKYKVLGPNAEHEYDIIIGGYASEVTYSLFASNFSEWTDHIKGTLMLKLTDDGNNIFFDRDMKLIDYSDAHQMKILLNFREYLDMHDKSYSNKYIVVEERVLSEV